VSQWNATYPITILHECLVIAADGGQEKNNLDVVEDMDPLLPLRSLSSNVEHTIGKIAQIEYRLADSSRPEARAEDVLVCWHVADHEESIYVFEKAVLVSVTESSTAAEHSLVEVVVQRILVAFQHGKLHARIRPQILEARQVFGRELIIGPDVPLVG
jgi:hypothetical protein